MTSTQDTGGSIWRKARILLGFGPGTGPVNSVAALENFVSTRSAFVAQKTLYGYVKTRMGIRYVAMFQDPAILASLNIAKMYVFAACLSDLSIYAVATVAAGRAVPNESSAGLARRCYMAGLRDNDTDVPAEFAAQDCIADFNRRLAETDWQRGARLPDNFTQSPAALARWAPVADSLKKNDTEIVENSVRYTWRDIREQFNKRLDAEAVAADWTRQGA